jgi:glutathione S-transferase
VPPETPVLWHLEPSHYNEKARWALDYKRVPHVRRAVTPGLQELTARRLGAGRTTPILQLNGRAIGDSTRIIEEIELRWPEPPLYPSDPEERRRALELEEYFDEGVGPDIRRSSSMTTSPSRRSSSGCSPAPTTRRCVC